MSFKVIVQPSGREFEVERDACILPSALAAGVGLPYGCKDGACGSCKSKLLEGRVIHGAHQLKALSVEEEAQGYILTCCSTPQTDLVIESRQVVSLDDFPILKMPVRVSSITKAAPDVAVIKLQLPANSPFKFHAGQYLEFILRDGSRRSYSMANAPHTLDQGVELHIRHMPGGKFTDHVFTAMKEKEILRAEGPFGSFFLREEATQPMVLLASGTGFAPIKSIIEYMREQGITRPATLYWGCRSRADLYMHEWAEQAAREMPNLNYVPVLSDPKPEDGWRGRQGLVHEAVMQDLPDLSGHQVYACGAPIMVDSARKDFTTRCKLPPEEFYADSFISEKDKHADA